MWYNSDGRGDMISNLEVWHMLHLGVSPCMITEVLRMFTRTEYEFYFGLLSDEEWVCIRKSIQRAFDEAADRMYEEDHPLDD